MRSQMRIGMLATMAGLLPMLATATDGAVEISQTCAVEGGCAPGDTAGFPVDLLQPGKYVLTSDLDHDPAVHGNTEIVRLLADDITLDLNGFTIRSTSTCESGEGNCPGGSVDGIDSSTADRATIHNGRIIGVDGNCIRIASEASVRNMIVSHCGLLGISVGPNSLVRDCRITSTGRTGLHTYPPFSTDPLAAGTLYRDCTFARNGLRGEMILPDMSASVSRTAKATGPNFCEDGLCGNGRRRFYIAQTSGGFAGGEAATACAAGFGVASVWELANPAVLEYDRNLGATDYESSGPPEFFRGWAYVGTDDQDCADWTLSGAGLGTQIRLNRDPADQDVGPWEVLMSPCDSRTNVYCIEK